MNATPRLPAALLALTLAVTPAAAADAPALKAEITVSGDVVRLGDLLSEAGPEAARPLFHAPAPGGHGTLAVERVLEAAAEAGLTGIATRGLSVVLVRRRDHPAAAAAARTEAPAPRLHVAVLRRPVARGQIIGPDDILAEERAAPAAAGLALPGEALGQAARRALPAGRPLAAADLVRPQAIAKGDGVTVTWRSGALNLSLRARALEAGAVGDTISVENPRTRRPLAVRIVAPGAADFTGPATAAQAAPVPSRSGS
jgi:flagella basal body P-ring formation protein FlgA